MGGPATGDQDADAHRRLGRNVRALRRSAGMNQEALAHAMGVHQHYVSELENGLANPTLATLSRIARAIGCAIHDLTNGI